jgi:hypothetical protein
MPAGPPVVKGAIMRRRVLAAFSVAASTILVLPAAAHASHSWNGYHWARTSNPFNLTLGDNLSSTWDPFLATTSRDWSESTVLDTTVVRGSTSSRTCKATTGRAEVCNATYGNNGWLGVASISVSGKHITKGSVKVNDTYFNTATYNTTAWRNLVMCQEVGHIFGLDHQDENFDNANLGTCMDYTSNPGTNQHPNQHDYDMLEQIYAHLDSTTTVGAALPGSSAVTLGNDPSGWGRVVDGSRAEGHSTYVRDLGNGNLVVSHVLWAR